MSQRQSQTAALMGRIAKERRRGPRVVRNASAIADMRRDVRKIAAFVSSRPTPRVCAIAAACLRKSHSASLPRRDADFAAALATARGRVRFSSSQASIRRDPDFCRLAAVYRRAEAKLRELASTSGGLSPFPRGLRRVQPRDNPRPK